MDTMDAVDTMDNFTGWSIRGRGVVFYHSGRPLYSLGFDGDNNRWTVLRLPLGLALPGRVEITHAPSAPGALIALAGQPQVKANQELALSLRGGFPFEDIDAIMRLAASFSPEQHRPQAPQSTEEAADAGAGEWETDGRNITFRYDGAILCTLPFDAARRHRTVHWFSPVTESLYLQGADYPAALSPALLAGNIRMDLFNVLVDKGESDEQAFIGAIREFPLEFMAVESIGVLSEHGDDAVASEAETPVEPPAPEPEPPAVPVRRDGGTFARIAEDVSEAFQLIGCLSIVITLFLVVVVSLVLIRLLGLSDFLSILIFIILGF